LFIVVVVVVVVADGIMGAEKGIKAVSTVHSKKRFNHDSFIHSF
jgi:hypothetical protein